MPRFSVGFGRRKSTAAADELQNAQLVADQPSFRVLERSELSNGKSFDGGARLSKATTTAVFPSRSELHHLTVEDNMFADLKNNNRYVHDLFLSSRLPRHAFQLETCRLGSH